MARLQTLVKATCLRRTKDMVKQSLDLPKRTERIESIKFGQRDRELYNFFKERTVAIASKEALRPAVISEPDEIKEGNLLTMITFLRLICNHGKDLLPASALQIWDSGGNISIDWEIMQNRRNTCTLCNAYIEQPCLNSDEPSTCFDCTQSEEEEAGNEMKMNSKLSSPFGRGPPSVREGLTATYITPSAKVEALIRNLREEQYTEAYSQNDTVVKRYPSLSLLLIFSHMSKLKHRSVVFSYWTKMLDLIQHALRSSGFCFQRIDGKSSLENRSKAITDFNEDPKCTVMLASIGSAGEG